MRVAIALAALWALTAGGPALAQSTLAGPPIGRVEVKAFQAIPKAKTAVQLTSDSHLARELRRLVMTRLSQRGNEVGFSGGNVMRMDVQYAGSADGTGSDRVGEIREPAYRVLDDNPNPPVPTEPRPLRRPQPSPVVAPAPLRIGLSLYDARTGKVLWTATASCMTHSGVAQSAGESMINAIFDNPDRSRVGDAGCPR